MDYGLESRFNKGHNTITRKIVEMLSDDSRTSIAEMSKVLGISRGTVSLWLKRAERAFGIRYTLDINEGKLGLENPHIILVKFAKRPEYGKIKEILDGSKPIQFAAKTKGDYDLLIYANTRSKIGYMNWDRRLRRELLVEYGGEWDTSDISFKSLGYLPLRGSAITSGIVPDKYKKMLALLNDNSRIPLNELSKELGLSYTATVYAFKRLMESGYVNRFTISLAPLEDVSLMSMAARFIPTSDYEGIDNLVRRFYTADDKDPLISRYVIAMPLVGSYDFFTIGVFDNPEIAYKSNILAYKREFKRYNKIDIRYAGITEVLVGRLPLRSIDAAKEFKSIPVVVEE